MYWYYGTVKRIDTAFYRSVLGVLFFYRFCCIRRFGRFGWCLFSQNGQKRPQVQSAKKMDVSHVKLDSCERSKTSKSSCHILETPLTCVIHHWKEQLFSFSKHIGSLNETKYFQSYGLKCKDDFFENCHFWCVRRSYSSPLYCGTKQPCSGMVPLDGNFVITMTWTNIFNVFFWKLI